MRKRVLVLVVIAVMAALLTACSYEKEECKKVCDLDYTVLREEEIPDELAQIIASDREQPFHVTYEEDALYIAIGYGMQKSGGYSIEVEDCYLSTNAIFLKTKLRGPKKEEMVDESQSYPYLVIKTEYRDERVVFED